MTIPSRSVNTTTVLVLFDDVFDSQVNDEDIFLNDSRPGEDSFPACDFATAASFDKDDCTIHMEKKKGNKRESDTN